MDAVAKHECCSVQNGKSWDESNEEHVQALVQENGVDGIGLGCCRYTR